MPITEPSAQPAYFDKFDASGSRASDAARQILQTTRAFRSVPDAELVVLDVGCGYGYTSAALATTCRRIVAIEPSPELFERSHNALAHVSNVELRPIGIEAVAERDTFDLAILDNVLEHIGDQPGALQAIAAALKPGGLLYLLVPNKLWPLEPHYGLPFLSYLPLSLANQYLRLTRQGTDYTDASYAPTYGRLVRLLSAAGFDAHFVIPGDLSLTAGGGPLHYRVGAAALRHAPWLWRIAKGFLVIAVRRS
ncbi:MAG TPA: class I SAM-dependent methyltransferase [Thermoanaerobaculia bacterium]|jgi:SAM-dependent methyltransferase